MKAIEITKPSKLEFKEFPSYPLKTHEVRVEVAFTCICGSDLKNINNPVQIPQILGHEFSGRIKEVSPELQGQIHEGQRVTAFPMVGCMQCAVCEQKKYRDCLHVKGLGFQLPGSFAEEVIVDSRYLVPLLDEISYEQGALLEHLCCGYRLMKEIPSQFQSLNQLNIVIIGDGPLALADLQMINIHFSANITIIGKHENRKDFAKKLGVSKILDSSHFDLAKEELPPFDICILAAPAEDTLIQVIPSIRPKGLIFPQVRIQSNCAISLIKKFEILLGRAFSCHLEDFYNVMSLIKDKKLVTNDLISSRIKLSKVTEVFSNFNKKNNTIKTLITNDNFVYPP